MKRGFSFKCQTKNISHPYRISEWFEFPVLVGVLKIVQAAAIGGDFPLLRSLVKSRLVDDLCGVTSSVESCLSTFLDGF